MDTRGPRSDQGHWRPIAWLVAFDAVTKQLAWRFLPSGEGSRGFVLFKLVPMLNRGVGSWARMALGPQAVQKMLVPSFSYLGLAIALLAVGRTRMSRRRAAFICAVAGLVSYGIGVALYPSLKLSDAGILRAKGIASGSLMFVLWWQAKPGLWKTATSLFVAGNLGNTLSMFVPPFATVDFMYSDLLHATIRLAVFNFADAYQLAGLACVVILLLRGAGRRIHPRESSSPH